MEQTKNVELKLAILPGEIDTAKIADQHFDKKFKPTGALAFFVLFMILGLIIWYGIYIIMLERI
jgi:hypothetical protein